MQNNIKATLIPYSEAPHQTMLPLQNWLSGFEFKSLNTHVAIASNEKGVIVVSVCYIKIDSYFLITAMEINPKETAEEREEAGNGIDMLLEQQAQLAGVTTLLMVKPGSDEAEEVRTYTPRVTHSATLQAPTRVAYIN
jgi:hypothetical protein